MSETNGNGHKPNPTITIIKPEATQPMQQVVEPIDSVAQVAATPQTNPEPAKTTERKPTVGRLALLLMVSLLGLNIYQGFTARPQVQESPVAVPPPAPTPTPIPPPNIDLNQSAVRRNTALSDAMREVSGQVGQVVCSRTEYLLRQAQAQMEADGTPIEVSLLRGLDYVRTQMRSTLLQTSQLTGSPEQSQISRTLAIDAQAILTALQFEYTGDPIPPCRVAMAPLLEKVDSVFGLAIQAREVLTEQQLRDARIQMRQYQPTPDSPIAPAVPQPPLEPTPTPTPQSPLP